MVMGNANGRKDGRDPSGVVNKIDEGIEQHSMDVHGAHHPPHLFIPQGPGYEPCNVDAACEKMRPVMITWSLGGKQVAIEGSWDNWKRREPLQRVGKEFTILKVLPVGVYHFRFIVDGRVMCAPDLPLDRDHFGNACNVLELQEYIPEAMVSMSEFESPASPESSYCNPPFMEEDFRKPPPELPPHLQTKFINESVSSSVYSNGSLPRPQHVLLNHLLVQSDSGRPAALSSTHRFLQKYVKVVLYKPSQR